MKKPDARKTNYLHGDILPRETLEKYVNLTNPQISKITGFSVHMVKKSLAHHGLYKGKVYKKICESCGIDFVEYIAKGKFCSNYCKHKSQKIWNRGLTKDDNIHLAKASQRMRGNKLGTLVDHQKKEQVPLHLPTLDISLSYDRKSKIEKEWLLKADLDTNIVNIKNSDVVIPYLDERGKSRNYYPDFIVLFKSGIKWLVEVKGEISYLDTLKIQAANEWCAEEGYQYRLITIGMVKRNDWAYVYAEPAVLNIPTMQAVMMSHAITWSLLSVSPRLRVGAVIVSSDYRRILGYGYNGDEKGGSNIPLSAMAGGDGFIHAEENAMLKVTTKEPAILFVTDMPCINCAKRILNAEYIKEIYYLRNYRDNSGVSLLISKGIPVYRLEYVDSKGEIHSAETAVSLLTPKGLT